MFKAFIKRILAKLVRLSVPVLYDLVDAEVRRVKIQKRNAKAVYFQSIGRGCNINPSATLTEPAFLAIGHNVHIGADCYISSEGGVQIQDHVHISRRVIIYASDHEFRAAARLPYGRKRRWRQVVIERNVWIGMNVCILPGVRIGEGAIIGMGAVIAKDVPPFAIVGQQSYRLLSTRDEDEYRALEKRKKFGGRNGAPVAADVSSRPKADEIRIAFVLSTGRSGSEAIVKSLSRHPEISAHHEIRRQLVLWSTEYASGRLSVGDFQEKLSELYISTSTYTDGILRVESDLKFFNCVEILAEILPGAKFIWLTRSAFDVVASGVGRGWYDPNGTAPDAPFWYWDSFRLQGCDCSELSEAEWASMTPFARNCWYWGYVNRTIASSFDALPNERRMTVTLEDLSDRMVDLQNFLGVVPHSELASVISNSAQYARYVHDDWSEEECTQFREFCGPMMTRLYPSDVRMDSLVRRISL